MSASMKMGGMGAESGMGGMLFPSWQTGPRLGAVATLEAYGTMPWLRAYLQKVSEDVASLTWQVFVATGDRGKAIRDVQLQRCAKHTTRVGILNKYAEQDRLREIVNHPILDLLSGGNEWFAGLVSMQMAQAHLDLIGETAWILEVNQFKMPVQAIPIPPTWIMQMPPEAGGCYRVVGPGSTWDVPKNRMFFAYHPNPVNPFRRGIGIGQVLADELETDEFAAKYTKDWFRNRAIPPVLISGLGVNINELKRLEEKWLSKFQRKGAGWLPHFLGSKVDVHQLSQSFQQQELGSLRKNEKDTIRQVIGVPPEIMGDVSNSNRSTIDGSDYIYQSRVIVPRAEFLRAALQHSMVPLFDERLILNYVNPVVEDREFGLKVRTVAPWAWSVDEWRVLGDSQPLPGGRGSVRVMPFNLTFNSQLSLVQPNLPPPPAPAAPRLPAGQEPKPNENPVQLPASGRALSAVKTLDYAQIAQIVSVINPVLLERAGLPVIRAAIEKFGQDTLDESGTAVEIVFDLQDPSVVQFLRTWGADRMSALVNETTKEQIRQTLSDGVEAGETSARLVQRIMDVFADATHARAVNIAASELTRASNFAAWMALRQAGFAEKEWLSTEDDRVRDTHVELDGTVIPIDDDFVSSSGASGPYPGALGTPEEDCQCRCAVITVLAERSLAARSAQWKTLDAERRPYEKRLEEVLAAAFRSQEEAVVSALSEHVTIH